MPKAHGIPNESDPDRDGDGVPNGDDPFPDDGNITRLPAVSIDSPESLVTVGSSPITVTGTVDPATQALTINGQAVAFTNETFSKDVALEEGHNTIIARVVDSFGAPNTASISVSLDMTPPSMTIDSHTDGQVVYSNNIIVTGLVNDIVRGTIESAQANVTVNGVVASIVNRSYAAEISLVEGDNTVSVIGTDQVGNIGTQSITVNYTIPVGKKIELTSGQGQSASITEIIPDFLVVRVLDDSLGPVVDIAVVFRVIQGSGIVGIGGANEGRAVVVQTNEDGYASTRFRVGSRVGTANHKVQVKVVGYDDDALFTASANSTIGDKISINSGNNQRGAVGQVLSGPFVVAVTDAGANVVQGARVRFDAVVGGGRFQNDQASIELSTDSDGRAAAEYTLGLLEGIDAQRVIVTLLDAAPGKSVIAGFSISGFVPGNPGDTTISGVVLDNQDNPVPGITLRVDGTSRQDIADENGLFKITEVPNGPVHLIADGSTATVPGEFPNLSYNMVTIAGVDNPLAAPIYMVKLDTQNAVFAGPEDVELTLAKYVGFKLEIAKDSVTFPDGKKEGLISVTPVNASKVPMAPPNGMQPQFIVTIQPTGAKFDPPAALTLPNVDGFAPGSQVEMFSYDHDLEEFVSIGLGTASEDGTVIKSNPGVGVVKAGWHCGSEPSGQGCCGKKLCPTCQKRENEDCSGNCIVDTEQAPKVDCRSCSDGALVVDDSSGPYGEKAFCSDCQAGKVEADTGKDGLSCSSNELQTCYTCKDGKCANNCNASTLVSTFGFKLTEVKFLEQMFENLENLKWPPFAVTDSGFNLSASGSVVSGEQCCSQCTAESKLKSDYTKYEGKVEAAAHVELGLVGSRGQFLSRIKATDYRFKSIYKLGPFVKFSGNLPTGVSYTDTACLEGGCFTIAMGASLGCQLSVGGELAVGFDEFIQSNCPSSSNAREYEFPKSNCYDNFKGVSGQVWATGGGSVSLTLQASREPAPCPSKCEAALSKISGKIFAKAEISLSIFTYAYEQTFLEGTLFEGKTYNCGG